MHSILYYIISKIKKLQSKDTEIDTEISGIKQDITDINGDITDINGDITDINGDITNINSDITDIKPRLTTAEENIETIQNNMMTNSVATVTDLNTDYTRTGQYFFNIANAPTNRPTGTSAGYLEVFVRSPNDMLQRWITYDDNCTTFQRQKRSGNWGNWNSL